MQNHTIYYDSVEKNVLIKQPSLKITQIDGTILEYYDLDKITNELITSIPNIKSAWINCSVVGNAAFYNNKTIESVYMTDKVETFEEKTVIQKGQFENCTNLKYVTFNSNVELCEGSFYKTIIENIILPIGFKKIGYSAFSKCQKLQNIVIPNTLTSILSWGLNSCSSLHVLNIPNSVTFIGDGAFCDCKNLNDINYDGTIQQWGAITKDGRWKLNVPTTCIVHCTDGDINI